MQALRERRPAQVIATPSLERPLRVLMAGAPTRIALSKSSDPALPSLYVTYLEGPPGKKKCIKTPERRCFRKPEVTAEYFVVWKN